MESFFSSLKTERTARQDYRTRDEARADVFDYIERFYNPRAAPFDHWLSQPDAVRKTGAVSLRMVSTKPAAVQLPHPSMRLPPPNVPHIFEGSTEGGSPVGVPPRLLPKGVVVPEARLTGQGFLRLGRSVWSISSPQPGGADLAQFERVLTPAPACPSPASTSRAGHSAGRLMPEPPENGVYGPARRHRTRPDRRGVPSPAASLMGEIRWCM